MVDGNFCSVDAVHGAYGAKFAFAVRRKLYQAQSRERENFRISVTWIDKNFEVMGLSTGSREIYGVDSLLDLISRVRYERLKRGKSPLKRGN